MISLPDSNSSSLKTTFLLFKNSYLPPEFVPHIIVLASHCYRYLTPNVFSYQHFFLSTQFLSHTPVLSSHPPFFAEETRSRKTRSYLSPPRPHQLKNLMSAKIVPVVIPTLIFWFLCLPLCSPSSYCSFSGSSSSCACSHYIALLYFLTFSSFRLLYLLYF